MDIVYNVNSYHTIGLPKLIRFLKTRPKLVYRDYNTIVSRFYSEVSNSNGYVDYRKIKLIQECMYVVSQSFNEKLYGYDKFLKFMSKVHSSRLKKINNTLRDWIINVTENPNHPIGRRRKIEEYNNTISTGYTRD